MSKTLITFLAITLFTSILAINPLPKLQGSHKGYVTIFQDIRGYYVGADFEFDPVSRSNEFGPSTHQMMLGLYTSQTLLPNKCLDFYTYSCKAYNCTIRENNASSVYPSFSASGKKVTATLYLEYTHWYLSVDSNALLTDTCTSSAEYGTGRYGILGLGRTAGSELNFGGVGYPVFSIYLPTDSSSGKLLFKNDPSYTKSSHPIAQIETDTDWKILIDGSISVGKQEYFAKTHLIFDLNADSIGFPRDLFQIILDYLSTFGVSCDESSYQPACSYPDGHIYQLPDIIITSGSFRIPIPPQLYVLNVGTQDYMTSFNLNINALGTNETGRSFVTNEYSNTIILDSSFMTYYYTVFDGADNRQKQKITLYISKNAIVPNDPNFIYYILGIIGLIVLLSVCIILRNKNKKNNSYDLQSSLTLNEQTTIYGKNHNVVEYSQPASNAQSTYKSTHKKDAIDG